MSKGGSNYLLQSINKSLEYCKAEFDMNYAETIGTIFLVLVGISNECINLSNLDDDKDGEGNNGSGS